MWFATEEGLNYFRQKVGGSWMRPAAELQREQFVDAWRHKDFLMDQLTEFGNSRVYNSLWSIHCGLVEMFYHTIQYYPILSNTIQIYPILSTCIHTYPAWYGSIELRRRSLCF